MLAKPSLGTEAGWHTLSSLSHAMGGGIWSHHIFPWLAKPYHMCIVQQSGKKIKLFPT